MINDSDPLYRIKNYINGRHNYVQDERLHQTFIAVLSGLCANPNHTFSSPEHLVEQAIKICSKVI